MAWLPSGAPPRRTNFGGQFVDRSPLHCLWPNITAPSMTSSLQRLDSTISTALAVPATTRSASKTPGRRGRLSGTGHGVTDTGRTDRTAEGNARQRQCGRGADQGRHVSRDFRIQGHHRRNDLDFVAEIVREQRPDRPVDQARGQGFAFSGASFALEEAARNAAAGVEPLLVIDGEGKKSMPSRAVLLPTAVTSTTVPPMLTRTEPLACRAISSPVSGDGLISELKLLGMFGHDLAPALSVNGGCRVWRSARDNGRLPCAEVIKQATALVDQLEQATAGMMVLLVVGEVFGQVFDTPTAGRSALRGAGIVRSTLARR